MNTLKSPINSITNAFDLKFESADLTKLCRRNESIQAYQKISRIPMRRRNGTKTETASAISQWLASGNVRLEFYSSVNEGEIRVRVLPHDSSETIRDLSLDEFLNMAPVAI